MNANRKREVLGLVVERRHSRTSENDIRAAFRRFVETAAVATLAEMTNDRKRRRVRDTEKLGGSEPQTAWKPDLLVQL